MIGTRLDLLETGLEEYEIHIALRYDQQRNVWVPVAEDACGCINLVDAAKLCTTVIQKWYEAIAEQARLMKLVSEHPDFDFEGDGVDSEMMRERIANLYRDIECGAADIDRLFDSPNRGDRIVVAGVEYQVDPETHMLCAIDQSSAADREFLDIVSNGLQYRRLTSGDEVSPDGIEQAITFLNNRLRRMQQAMRGNHDAAPEDTSTSKNLEPAANQGSKHEQPDRE